MNGDFAPNAIDLAREAAFELGNLSVSPSTREVAIGDRSQILEPRVMQVLVALARRRGQVVSRQDLFAACWGGRTVGEESINRCIAALRRVSETYGGFSIATIARVGYRLDAALADDGSETPTVTQRKPSVCVLPFANMSGDPEQTYFSDGISEDIITDLSKVSALSVTARNTAFSFKGRSPNVRELARQLGVSHFLDGSVRKSGDRVRITVQLNDGATGNQLWAERYDRDFADIFVLQDEISQAVVSALKLKLLPEERKAIEKRGTDSVEAFELYLMARQHWLTGNQGDMRREEAIIRLTKRATEIDPGYARAWAQMAWSQSVLVLDYGGSGDNGLDAAERALALDANLAEAHAARARVLYRLGREDDAAHQVNLALRLDPESHEANGMAGIMAYGARRFDDAIRHFGRAATASEANISAAGMLLSARMELGDEEGARLAARMTLERVEKVLDQDHSNGHAMAWGGAALAVLGEREQAREWGERALLVDPENRIARYIHAGTLSFYFGDALAALKLLGPVLASDPGPLVSFVKTSYVFDSMREDPRFRAMIAAAETRLEAASAKSGRKAPIPSDPVTIPSPAPLLAVLAFDNLSGDPEMAFFSDGVSEEILQTVARATNLKVIGRTSSFQFRGAEKGVTHVAEELNVTHLLDGAVRRSGQRVRVSAQLIECAGQTTLWSNQFDHELSDVLAVQDEIAAEVANALSLTLAPLSGAAKIDPNAYDLFLKANAVGSDPESIVEVVSLLERAVTCDPNFAAAWAHLALARTMEARWRLSSESYVAGRQKAIEAANRAEALDHVGAKGLLARGMLEPSRQFESREALLDKALSAAPSDPDILRHASNFAASVGRIREAYRLTALASEIDPFNRVVVINTAGTLADVGRVQESYRAFEAARERWPDYDAPVVLPLLMAGHFRDWDTAQPLIEIAKTKTGAGYRRALSTVQLYKRPIYEVREKMRGVVDRQLEKTGSVNLPTALFMHSAGLVEEAFEAISRSSFDENVISLEHTFMIDIIFGIMNAGMRNDPRFVQLCSAFRLCNYWVKTDRWPDCADQVSYDFRAEARRLAVV